MWAGSHPGVWIMGTAGKNAAMEIMKRSLDVATESLLEISLRNTIS